MLILSPEQVALGSIVLDRVVALTVDRTTARSAEHWSDLGPFQVYFDAPEQRVIFTIVQELAETTLGWLRPGELTSLRVQIAPSAGDQGRRAMVCDQVVVESIRHELGRERGGGGGGGGGSVFGGGGPRAARRVIRLVGLSGNGQDDVVRFE